MAVHRGLKEDRGDFLVWLKRTWLRFLGNLDQAGMQSLAATVSPLGRAAWAATVRRCHPSQWCELPTLARE